MIQNYFPNLPKQELSIQDELWDSYLDKQLSHLVLEFSFDFERIAQALKSIKYKQSETAIDREKCQNRWYFLHNKRKNEQSNPIIIEETNEQKFNKLMSRVSPPETFDIFEQKIDETNIPSGHFYMIISFNGF